MIEYITKSKFLAQIIIITNYSMSYYFLDNVCKTDWSEVFKNIDKYKDIIPFIRKSFIMKYYKDDYLFSMLKPEKYEILEILLQKGADVHAQNDYPLTYASVCGFYKIVELLLKYGANANALNDNVCSMESTIACGHIKVIKILVQNGADIHNNALHYAVVYKRDKIVKFLLETGASVNAQNNETLIYAIKNGYYKVVELLLRKGADVNAENGKPLEWAILKNHSEIVRILLENGAGMCILKAIKLSNFGRNREVIRIILEKASGLNLLLNEILRWAILVGYTEVVDFLTKRP